MQPFESDGPDMRSAADLTRGELLAIVARDVAGGDKPGNGTPEAH